MSATSALRRGRAAHEKLMIDRCVIESVTTSATLNEATGNYDTIRTRVYPPLSSLDADGPCLLAFNDTVVQQVDAAGQILTQNTAILSLPVATSTEVAKDHIVTYTASVNDADLVGVQLRVEGPQHETFGTARKLRVEET
ncbi:DUF6093 family protein [Cryobacterium cryoconiti]|uniref:Uncharacterized protein n=1 Tax=Cryobacterium cryoconiti TaxID=1259239 RepID=A0A4Y8JWJ9_9MICO|nr:DUF6093 family protein [Cryobacterium cryoconiti]TFD27519.1 hypothetical protein E3T49_13335 [Cryobacterium cryoconiti]